MDIADAEDVVDQAFNEMGIDAAYTPPGAGTSIPCRIIFHRRRGDRESGGIHLGGPVTVAERNLDIQVRSSEVDEPEEGGSFAIGSWTDGVFTAAGKTFTQTQAATAEDVHTFCWRCSVVWNR